MDGAFISDDHHYVRDNPYIHELSLENVIAIWDPTSVVTLLVENYAPAHLMLHGIEWQLFGLSVQGYHVVNVLFHALASVMLVAIYRRSGIAEWPAALGALVFFLHPANVESVAWISQLKSSSALVLSAGAILLHPRRPLAATLCYTLALFAKPFSAFALIIVALFGAMRRAAPNEHAEGATAGYGWPWLGLWLAITLGFGAIEALAFANSAGSAPPLYTDLLIRYLTIFSIALRYLGMAVTGLGLSAFHEPAPVQSPVDPLFLLAVVIIGALGWRVIHCLMARKEEGVYWLWAAVSFAPLSGVVPLPYPMADRYLYFVLPGLIGAVLLGLRDLEPIVLSRLSGVGLTPLLLQRATLVLVALLCAHFAVASHSRAGIFRSGDLLMADAERNYPEGAAANTRKASRASRNGQFELAVKHLALAQKRGYNRLDHLLQDPSYAPIQDHPPFVEIKKEMARDWLERLGGKAMPSQIESRSLAQAYIVLGDLEAALGVIERAIGVPGPWTSELEGDAEMLRRQIELNRRIEAERRGEAAAGSG